MRKGKIILVQMQELISRYNFEKFITEYNGDKSVKKFKTINLLSVMLYTHVSAKQSLRDICNGLQSKMNYWYHLGFRSLSRNNLSHALKKRPNQIFEKAFYYLYQKLREERGLMTDNRFKFSNPLVSLDSTTISLCLSLFDWAKFRKTKGGIKLHVYYNNKEQLPEFILMTIAKLHDVKAALVMPVQAGSIYVADRAYLCFKYFEKIRKNRAFFVIRTKKNTQYKVVERRKKYDKSIKADWIIKATGVSANDYNGKLRLVRYYDKEKKRTFDYLTNNFSLSAKTIADIYKSRWEIELFFKFIKQNLKVKTFIGTSENAVLIQVWTAMIACLLIEFIRFKSRTTFSAQKVWSILSDNVFQSYSLLTLFTKKEPPKFGIKQAIERQLEFSF